MENYSFSIEQLRQILEAHPLGEQLAAAMRSVLERGVAEGWDRERIVAESRAAVRKVLDGSEPGA